MATLREIAKVIRTKNAGPFYLTADVMFDDEALYRRVLASNVFDRAAMAALYRRPPDDVTVIAHDASRSIKITLVRRVPAGDPDDTDIYGAQQHLPLLNLHIPDV
ncbi:MAG: DUF4387 domain-containing protein [Candidatus Rokubacteria bacterium]|nr:DUF4387 domain-containing protein [Candidatus Rokubacteria bacterium]